MFGYIAPDAPYLFKKDETLYKALYCGICKSIGACCGQRARTALTYDAAFLSALVHNINGEDVKITKQRCAVHLIKKRPIAHTDETSVAIGCVNTALAYFKLCDDKADGDIKGCLRHLYKKGFKRVLKKYPDIAKTVALRMGEQSEVEKSGCSIIDMAAEATAALVRDLSRILLGDKANENTDGLFYSIGKWIYLIDAFDDYDKDVKKGRYNVLFNAYGEKTRSEAIKKGGSELKFIFDLLFTQMRNCLAGIKFYFNHDLIDNVILRGIPLKTRELFYGTRGECRAPSVETEKELYGQKES